MRGDWRAGKGGPDRAGGGGIRAAPVGVLRAVAAAATATTAAEGDDVAWRWEGISRELGRGRGLEVLAETLEFFASGSLRACYW